MPVLDPVIWAKGTVLNPQHLQLQDRFLADSLWFDLQALHFRPWGFQSIRIDPQALAGGTFVLAEAAGILNDGLLFQIPAADPAPPSRGFADRFGKEQESLGVFLAIPRYREQGLNVANPERRVEARYRAEIEMVRDENTGQSERPVVLARKNFRILFEGEAQEGNSLLQMARIRRTPAGLFQLDPHFVAPLLDLRASDYLLSIARRLVEILSAKSSELAAVRRQKNQSLADFTASDIANFWLLYTINSSFPVISHLFEGGGCHPEALFSAMLSLAGALTTFSQKIHPRDLPAYDHDDLGACFTDLDEKLRMLLETVVPSNFVSLPLKLVQPNMYACSIDRDEYLKHAHVPGRQRRHERGGPDFAGAPPDQDLLRRPHQHPGAESAAGSSADSRLHSAQRHSGQAELSVLHPEPERRTLGDDPPRPQPGGLRARRIRGAPARAADPAAASGIAAGGVGFGHSARIAFHACSAV